MFQDEGRQVELPVGLKCSRRMLEKLAMPACRMYKLGASGLGVKRTNAQCLL